MIITFDPNAEVYQYLQIPRGFCVRINGTDYILREVEGDGLSVWPWDDERALNRDYLPDDQARKFEWPEIDSLHVP